ncbi:MAG: hypothetical protein HPY45_17355 [Anaerolineae bacterium]|nr:hypothetical protein [Anaerolineae bacterium]
MPKPRVQISSRQLSPSAPQASQEDNWEDSASPVSGRRPSAKRVELIPIARIMPDAYQARTLLPPQIAERFFRFEIDWYDAARQWLELARQHPAIAQRVNSLLSLGSSMHEYGQVKTVTGSWQTIDGRTVFVLETGERRFWGVALNTVYYALSDEPLLEAVSVAAPNRIRQVVENEKYETPNAVTRARAVAALILHFYDIYPQHGVEGRNDYHRAALDKRLTRVTWAEIERIMGIGRPALVRHLQILELPDHLLEMADLYNVPERILREIRQLPKNQWEAALTAAIEQGLTSEDIPSLAPPAPRPADSVRTTPPRPADAATRTARRVKTLLAGVDTPGGVDSAALADALCVLLKGREPILRMAERLESLARQLRLRA